MNFFGTMKLSGLARTAAASSLWYFHVAGKVPDELLRDDEAERIGAHGRRKFPVVLHPRPRHRLEVDPEPERDPKDSEDKDGRGYPGNAEPRRAHRRDLAVRGQPPESQQDAGQNSQGT